MRVPFDSRSITAVLRSSPRGFSAALVQRCPEKKNKNYSRCTTFDSLGIKHSWGWTPRAVSIIYFPESTMSAEGHCEFSLGCSRPAGKCSPLPRLLLLLLILVVVVVVVIILSYIKCTELLFPLSSYYQSIFDTITRTSPRLGNVISERTNRKKT
jgi:hypothetical protein